MKIYGLTVVCSEGYLNGTESRTWLFTSKEERDSEAWNDYAQEIMNYPDDIDVVIDDKEIFIRTINDSNYLVCQWSCYHMQWEIFEQEI